MNNRVQGNCLSHANQSHIGSMLFYVQPCIEGLLYSLIIETTFFIPAVLHVTSFTVSNWQTLYHSLLPPNTHTQVRARTSLIAFFPFLFFALIMEKHNLKKSSHLTNIIQAPSSICQFIISRVEKHFQSSSEHHVGIISTDADEKVAEEQKYSVHCGIY